MRIVFSSVYPNKDAPLDDSLPAIVAAGHWSRASRPFIIGIDGSHYRQSVKFSRALCTYLIFAFTRDKS